MPAHQTRAATGRAGDRDPALETFLRGTRSVADSVAPSGVEVAPRHARVDADFARAIAVTALPPQVGPVWLDRLLHWPTPLKVALHIRPVDNRRLLDALRRRQRDLGGELNRRAGEGRVEDPALRAAHDQVRDLREDLVNGRERLFSLGVTIGARERDEAALARTTDRLFRALRALGAEGRVLPWRQEAGLRAVLPLGRDPLGVGNNVDTSGLALMFPCNHGSLPAQAGHFLGIAPDSRSMVTWDPFDGRAFNANLCVLGKSGAGKSFFTKSVLLQACAAGQQVVAIDPEGECRALCERVGGLRLRYSVSPERTLNPLDLPLPPDQAAGDDGEDEPNPVVEGIYRAGQLVAAMVDAERRGIDGVERALISRALRDAYAGAGIAADDPASWRREPPLLRHVAAALAALPGPEARGLALRLGRYTGDGEFAALFDRPTTVRLDGPFVLFDVRDIYEDDHLLALVLQQIAGWVWGQTARVADRRPRLLAIDEAHRLVGHPAGGELLARLARRARKRYLAVLILSQNADDFIGTPAGRAVLANAAATLLLAQEPAVVGQVGDLFGLTAAERLKLVAPAKGEGFFFSLGGRVWLQVGVPPGVREILTTAPAEIARRRATESGRAPAATSGE